jgi:hypothetical protein
MFAPGLIDLQCTTVEVRELNRSATPPQPALNALSKSEANP